MSEPVLVERVGDIDVDPYVTPCRGCGKQIVLRMNGGELDADWCCGYRYRLTAPRIDFEVHREVTP